MNKQLKSVLLLTGSDSNMWEVLDLTIPSKCRYVNKYGYDLMIKKTFQEFTEYDFSKDRMQMRYIGFSRLLNAFLMLEHYDVVMWIDGDSIITNPDLSIEHFINDDQCFYASYDWACSEDSKTGRTSFSTGNFILQRTKNISELYNAFYQASRRFLDDEGAEQSTLNYVYNTDYSLRNSFKILDQHYLNAVPDSILETKVWSSDPNRSGITKTMPIVNPWTPDSFLAHLTGCTNQDRINQLNTYFTKYL
jgi:hypothetical protein